MARNDSTDPVTFMHRLLPPAELRRLAGLTGFCKRVRKLDVVAFVSSVVFVLCGRGGQSFAAMRRSYILTTGCQLVRSAFHDRFTPAFGEFIVKILGRLQRRAHARRPELRGLLSGFRDVVAVDATVVQVHDSLADRWPGTRWKSSPACIKVHTWIRALTGELLQHRITGERRSDGRTFGIGWAWRRCLFLFDRGFPSASMWWRIHRVDAYFLTRLPGSYKPRVVGENRRHRGRARVLLDQPLRDMVKTLKRTVIDIDCDFRVHIRPYRGPRGRYIRERFRVVGLWNTERRDYDFYVTNLRPEQMPAEALRDLYRLRWEVETHYRVGKGGLGLGELPTRKAHVVQLLVRAALIRASIGMQARREASKRLRAGLWVNTEQWIRVWQQFLGLLAIDLALGRRSSLVSWDALAWLATDPNQYRRPNRHVWEQGEWATSSR